MPDSILTNDSLGYVRDWMLEHFRLRVIVSLPQSAFAHFGTNVKTSIVFVEKRYEVEHVNPEEKILMCAPSQIGYSSTGKTSDSDLAEIADICRKFIASPGDYRPPQEILEIPLQDLSGIDRFVVERLGHRSIASAHP